jgi:hypothetical protein
MNRDKVFEKINQYFTSWIEKDFNLFESVLHDESVIRECTGTVIQGRDQLNGWFLQWNGNGNEVVSWEIKNIGYDSESLNAFVEWNFICKFKSRKYEFEGSSIICFENSLIKEINEYEMKKKKSYPYKQEL